MNADAKHKLIRHYQVTDASVHDSRKFDGLLNKANTSADVYADSAYRSTAIEAKLKARGLRSRIHQRASRNHALSKAQENANHQKSKVRARRAAVCVLAALLYGMAAPTNAAYVKKILANSEPSTHGTLRQFRPMP